MVIPEQRLIYALLVSPKMKARNNLNTFQREKAPMTAKSAKRRLFSISALSSESALFWAGGRGLRENLAPRKRADAFRHAQRKGHSRRLDGPCALLALDLRVPEARIRPGLPQGQAVVEIVVDTIQRLDRARALHSVFHGRVRPTVPVVLPPIPRARDLAESRSELNLSHRRAFDAVARVPKKGDHLRVVIDLREVQRRAQSNVLKRRVRATAHECFTGLEMPVARRAVKRGLEHAVLQIRRSSVRQQDLHDL